MPSTLRSALFALAVLGCTFGHAPGAAAQEREPRLHTYAAGAGFTVMRYRLEDGTAMGASGPALTFDYSVGRRWSFTMRGAFMFPMHGSQRLSGESSEGVNLVSMYDSTRTSFDLMFMVGRRLHLNPQLDLVVAGGIDVQLFRVLGVQYNPVELISGGFGGLARVERKFGRRFLYGGEVTASFDPLDFIHHDNRAVFVAPVSFSAFIGVTR